MSAAMSTVQSAPGLGRRDGSLGPVSVLGTDAVTRKSATGSIVRPELVTAQDGQWTMTA